jgi:hypothetical protein
MLPRVDCSGLQHVNAVRRVVLEVASFELSVLVVSTGQVLHVGELAAITDKRRKTQEEIKHLKIWGLPEKLK